jgi:uncharacterized membrane protein
MASVAQAAVPRTRLVPFALFAVCANLAITLPLASILNVWQDDAYTLHSTSSTVSYAFREAIGFEQNAPLYFVVMTIWGHLHQSAFFARLFSVLCASGVVALAPRLSSRYLPTIDPRWVTVVFAFNPFLIWAALEIRLYALVILLSALLLLWFDAAFSGERPRAVPSVLYALCAVAALYTQYYLAFLIAAQGIVLFFTRRRNTPWYLVAAFAAALAFVPMLVILPHQVQNFRGAFAPPHSPLQSAFTLAAILVRYILPLDVTGDRKAAYALTALTILTALALLRRSFTRQGNAEIVAVSLIACALFAFGIYAAGVHLLNRHAAMLLCPVLLSTFAVLSFVNERVRSRVVAIWSIAMLCSFALTLTQTYRAFAKPGDWIRVNAYIRAHESPGEPIAVFQAENALPFEYYYKGPNRVVAVPHGVDFRQYDVRNFVVDSQQQIRAVFPNASRVWMITAGECKAANIDFGCAKLERYLSRHYRVQSRARFYKATVRFLVARPSKKASANR